MAPFEQAMVVKDLTGHVASDKNAISGHLDSLDGVAAIGVIAVQSTRISPTASLNPSKTIC